MTQFLDEKTCVIQEGMRDANREVDVHDEAIQIDAELRAIALTRQQLHAREAVLLVRAEEVELWRRFGCATLLEYLERFCDLHPRTAREYMRVSRALTQLPQMRAQLDAQRIAYSTARELTRIATPETEADWLAHVAGMTPREIEQEVAGREKGDGPVDPKDPDTLVKLVLEIRSSTYAEYVEARTRLSDARGERLSDDETVKLMARGAAGHPDTGTPSYQLAITTCRSCAKSHQIGGGREVEVSAATVEKARCDAQHLGDLEADKPTRIVSSVSKRMRRHVMTRDNFICRVPGCRSMRFLDVHHIVFKSKLGSNKASNLITLCSGHHQQLHDGKLAVSGTAPHAVTFTWPGDPHRTSTRDRSGGDQPCPMGRATFEDAARAAAEALRSNPPEATMTEEKSWPSGPRQAGGRGRDEW